jgi:hypothetical protein
MIEPIRGALHLLEVMAVIAGGGLFLVPFPHDAQFFVAELHDLRQGLLNVHPIACLSALVFPWLVFPWLVFPWLAFPALAFSRTGTSAS